MPANTTELEKRLWGAADELPANSKLKSSEYSVPVLGLIFLRYAVLSTRSDIIVITDEAHRTQACPFKLTVRR
jgi:type I site-specific restriction-modification system R (restriction) subunit